MQEKKPTSEVSGIVRSRVGCRAGPRQVMGHGVGGTGGPSGMNHPNWEPPADNLGFFHEGSLRPPLSLVTTPMRAERLPNLLEMRDTGSQCHHLPLPVSVHIVP